MSGANSAEYEDQTPLDIVESWAKEKTCWYKRVSEESAAFIRQGVWGNYSFAIEWSEEGNAFGGACRFDILNDELFSPKMIRQFYELTNRLNALGFDGFFYFCAEEIETANPGLYYNFKLFPAITEDGGITYDSDIVEWGVQSIVETCDLVFPALSAVFLGEATPKNSLDKIMYCSTEGYLH